MSTLDATDASPSVATKRNLAQEGSFFQHFQSLHNVYNFYVVFRSSEINRTQLFSKYSM